jgi:transcriptional regulator with XRE-family HTH domain
MKRRRISRAKLASRMKTSTATLDRLFAPNHSSVTLQLLEQVALALGRKLKIELA